MTKVIKKIPKTDHIKVISRSYDLSIELRRNRINLNRFLPEKFWKDPEYKNLLLCRFNSGMADIKKFLNPKIGQKYIDLGCYLNLYNYKLYRWPSTYYGVDFSKLVVEDMKKFSETKNIKIGGFYNSPIDKLPFKNNFFQLATCINVFEYYDLKYIDLSLKEIHRVLVKSANFVADIPNIRHSALPLAYKIEEFYGRPNLFKYPKEKFENLLSRKFDIIQLLDSDLMIRYYLRVIK